MHKVQFSTRSGRSDRWWLAGVVLAAGALAPQNGAAVRGDEPAVDGPERAVAVERPGVEVQIVTEVRERVTDDGRVVQEEVAVPIAVEGVIGVAVEATPAIPPQEGEPAAAEADPRQKLLAKLREPVNIRLNNVSLQAAFDKLSQEHGFRFRFDAEGLKEAKVDPEKAQVGINLRRRALAGVLREILSAHNLRFALERDEVVVLSRPALPAGVKRRKVADSAPVERVVLGNLVVSDKSDEAESKEAMQAVRRAVAGAAVVGGAVINADAQKQMQVQQRAQFKQQFQTALRTELALSLNACQPTPEQRTEIRKVAEKAFEEAGDQWVDIQVKMMRGWNGQPPKYPNVREEIQLAITAAVDKLLAPEAAAAYRKEVEARVAHRRKTTIQNLVVMVDRNVVLSQEQRVKLATEMEKHWKPAWGNALEYLQWDGNNVFPNVPAECMESVLNKTQLTVWAGVQKMDPSQFWGGGGFGFFNAQIAVEDAVIIEGDVGEGAVGVIVNGEANGVVVDVIALPDPGGRLPPAEEKPAEEKPAEAQPEGEKPAGEPPAEKKPPTP